MSLALYYQMVGRCVRPHKDKVKAYVFDFVGNFDKFGKVENLVIENRNGWCIHNGKNVLTNADISEKTDIPSTDDPIINFGKYNGKRCSEIHQVTLLGFLKTLKERKKQNELIFSFIEKNIKVNATTN